MDTETCPAEEALLGYVVGRISEQEAAVVAAHLEQCSSCQRRLETLETRPDPMLAALRQPAGKDRNEQEPACRDVLEKLRAARPEQADTTRAETRAAPEKASRRATRLGDYELLKQLGQGGMGTVYQARHSRLKRVVALKVLPKDRLNNEEAVRRFEREMEAVGRLDHPHIVRATDAREERGIRYLVMEYVDGLDLAEIVKRCGPLSIADACEVTRQAAEALSCSQENGLVHRDVKPSNFMLDTQGRVKLLDLGLAQCQEAESLGGQITGVGQVMGTPDFLSPEQALESHAVDIRTDVYSLGATLYHLLSGRGPFSGPEYDSAMKKVLGHLRDPVPPIQVARPGVPRPVAALLARMLAKEPAERPSSPAEVANVLRPLCQGSKLIALLRDARRKQPAEPKRETSHVETNEFADAAMVETSRTQIPSVEGQSKPSPETGSFDPYHRWLGIPPSEQPASHYRLLGLAPFESDREVIRDAAARQMAHVRSYHLGQHAELSQEILNELAVAKACLLNRDKKAAYDTWLREQSVPPPLAGASDELVGSLTDEKGELAPLVTDSQRLSTLVHGKRARVLPRIGRRHLQWTAIALIPVILLLGIVLIVNTKRGRVRIALSDPAANVQVKVDGDVIELSGPKDPLRLEPGEHQLVVTGPDYRTVGRSFMVRQGQETLLDVELMPHTRRPTLKSSRKTGGQDVPSRKSEEAAGASASNPKAQTNRSSSKTPDDAATPDLDPAKTTDVSKSTAVDGQEDPSLNSRMVRGTMGVFQVRIVAHDVDFHKLRLSAGGIESLENRYGWPTFVINGYEWHPETKRYVRNEGDTRFFPPDVDFSMAQVHLERAGHWAELTYQYSEDGLLLDFRHLPAGAENYCILVKLPLSTEPIFESQPQWLTPWRIRCYSYDEETDGRVPEVDRVERRQAVADTRTEHLDWIFWGDAPIEGMPDDFAVAVAERTFRAEEGVWRLETLSDDGIRVFIDGKRVLDNWTCHRTKQDIREFPIASGEHLVRVEFFERNLTSRLGVWLRRMSSGPVGTLEKGGAALPSDEEAADANGQTTAAKAGAKATD